MQTEKLCFKLAHGEDYRNMTPDIQRIIKDRSLKDGLLHIFVMHTTCALLLQEDEPCMVQDLLDRLGKIAPRSARNVPPTSLLYYRHDDHRVRTVNLEPKGRERINGHAHVKASFLSPFLIFWVVNGVIQLGEFQQILFFDFDDLGERRERQVSVTFISDNS